MANKCQYSKVVIPGDHDYTGIAGNFTSSVAQKLGFNEKNAKEIQYCTEQAITWAIDYSLADNEKISIEVSCEVVPQGFKVAIRDQGVPFDPSLLKKENSEELSGFLPLEACIDEVLFNNLGPQGKEIVLLKYSHEGRITDHFDACELERFAEPPEPVRSADLSYVVRAMKPDEAIEVSKCIYKGYGYTYPHEHMYYPAKLVEMNQDGSLFSVVAVTNSGDIAGHGALMYDSVNDRIAELGLGVVKPKYRTLGCSGKVTEFLIEKAIAEKLGGVFAQAVTVHNYSQQIANRYLLKESALLLAYIPTTVDFRHVEQGPIQRVTVFLCFRHLKTGSSATLYLPKKHRAMIAAIYGNLGITPVLEPPLSEKETGFDTDSILRIKVITSMGFARIVCETYGSNFIREIEHRVRELCLKKIEVINLYLDLSNPHSGFVSENLEKLGMFFAGVLPGAMPNGSDALIYQYLNNVEVRYEKVAAYTDIAKELLTYVKTQDANSKLH